VTNGDSSSNDMSSATAASTTSTSSVTSNYSQSNIVHATIAPTVATAVTAAAASGRNDAAVDVNRFSLAVSLRISDQLLRDWYLPMTMKIKELHEKIRQRLVDVDLLAHKYYSIYFTLPYAG
jgi:hypothetical protein